MYVLKDVLLEKRILESDKIWRVVPKKTLHLTFVFIDDVKGTKKHFTCVYPEKIEMVSFLSALSDTLQKASSQL